MAINPAVRISIVATVVSFLMLVASFGAAVSVHAQSLGEACPDFACDGDLVCKGSPPTCQAAAATPGSSSDIPSGLSNTGTPAGSTAAGGSGINTTYLDNYKSGILYVINSILVPVLISIAFLVFLWGVAQAYIISGASEDAREEGHKLVLWGIIGFVVIFSVWGIVNIVGATLGLSAGGTASGNGLTPPQL